ncbi:arginine-ornithine antiporter [Corynebacterium kroppenstedtii]|uniref:arginine-ornithine antiporter n=1 Tax=Corynebacterium sp. PCR 32 TaxID=3351342 RepID=UPI00309E457C
MVKEKSGLPFMSLLALVVGSMIGGGIFSLPQNIAVSASAGPIIIGWGITGIGMICLAFTYQFLSNRKPELDNGVYAYARSGFGDFVGFNSAWGYWLSALIGNVGYVILLFSTIGKFLPIFKGGNTIPAIVCASILLWSVHFLILNGVENAAFINIIATAAKIIPILSFIIICIVGFKYNLFAADFWGGQSTDLGGVVAQTKNMMMVTVWVFIGIEGANVFSKRARQRSDVGKATVIGFLVVLALLVAVNLLSLGIMQRADVASLGDASMADVLAHAVGSQWGAWFVSIGVILSLVGALLAWILLAAETLMVPGQDGVMPKFFGRMNEKKAPVNSLWLTDIVTTVILVASFFSKDVYYLMATLSASLILVPYLLSAGYGLLVTARGETYVETQARGRVSNFVAALVATLYGFWLLYAAGWQALLLAALIYLPGVILYVWAKREKGDQSLFRPYEWIIFAVLVIAAIAAICNIVNGTISVG